MHVVTGRYILLLVGPPATGVTCAMREPISIDERAEAQEAAAQGKEWKPDPPAPAPKEPKAEPKSPQGKTPEEQPDKAAPGNMPWNRRG